MQLQPVPDDGEMHLNQALGVTAMVHHLAVTLVGKLNETNVGMTVQEMTATDVRTKQGQ